MYVYLHKWRPEIKYWVSFYINFPPYFSFQDGVSYEPRAALDSQLSAQHPACHHPSAQGLHTYCVDVEGSTG